MPYRVNVAAAAEVPRGPGGGGGGVGDVGRDEHGAPVRHHARRSLVQRLEKVALLGGGGGGGVGGRHDANAAYASPEIPDP